VNNLSIIGRLTGDYELKYTSNSKPIGSFTIAVDDGWGDNKHTSFFDVVAFGKQAENHGNFIRKGSKVGIEGGIRQDRWEAQDGSKRSKIKITANRIEYLDSKPKGNDSDVTTCNDKDIPF